jgi:hypothetical protein
MAVLTISRGGKGRRNSACYRVFLQLHRFVCQMPLPPRALSFPEKPRTCPQNPSPTEARPSRWWTPKRQAREASSKGARSLLHRRKAKYRDDASWSLIELGSRLGHVEGHVR